MKINPERNPPTLVGGMHYTFPEGTYNKPPVVFKGAADSCRRGSTGDYDEQD